MSIFKLGGGFKPAGDQPKAIKSLVNGLKKGFEHQTLLGVTGSGKTFTAANVIAEFNKPTLVIAHNKTLAAQLAAEYQDFFPQNAVHYFVSYYDYYQPEAYIPVSDTYIEKEAQINEEIDRLRHASTQALLTRKDVIIVASVSCIYGLGSPEEYEKVNLKVSEGQKINRGELIRNLIGIYFERNNTDLKGGQFRAVENSIEVMPTNERVLIRIDLDGDFIIKISKIDPVSRTLLKELKNVFIFPAKHFVSNKDQIDRAFKTINLELKERLSDLERQGKNLEADRLKRRVKYDLSLIKEVGYCNGIENYSRHFSGKKEGEPPETLLSYFPKSKDGRPDFLTIIDESHVTVPQIRGMFNGDASRKQTLVDFGFRLPSAKDNRPLKFDEFKKRVGSVIYTSATPAEYERNISQNTVEQVIRPTGLVDPQLEIKPITPKNKKSESQIVDFIKESEKDIKKGGRVLATTLTKKMAEDLSSFLSEKNIKSKYLHSDIDTLERIEILSDFRRGKFDCLVGVNLLREGLDLPEVSLIGILDADKEGFLRSETSLIQTIGRAARNSAGRVILYADNLTGSIQRAVNETNRRRSIQIEYNSKNNITPKTIVKKIRDIGEHLKSEREKAISQVISLDLDMFRKNPKKFISLKKAQMSEAVKNLDFETAALIRDEIFALENKKPLGKTS